MFPGTERHRTHCLKNQTEEISHEEIGGEHTERGTTGIITQETQRECGELNTNNMRFVVTLQTVEGMTDKNIRERDR